MSRFWTALVVASLAAGVACTLNPQPLPPSDPPESSGADSHDAGSRGNGDGGAQLEADASRDSGLPTSKDGGDGGSDANADVVTDASVTDAKGDQ